MALQYTTYPTARSRATAKRVFVICAELDGEENDVLEKLGW